MTEIVELNCYCTNCEHKEVLKTHAIIDLASVICPICNYEKTWEKRSVNHL